MLTCGLMMMFEEAMALIHKDSGNEHLRGPQCAPLSMCFVVGATVNLEHTRQKVPKSELGGY
jgi:hypothetical protein